MIILQDKCMSCGQCEAVCRVGAISSVGTDGGYSAMQIDQKICVDCGMCLSCGCPGDALIKKWEVATAYKNPTISTEIG
jgi:ferredoxin